jgi:hypothetical protein
MYSDEHIIAQLGIADTPEKEQKELINEAQVRIGESISKQLTDEQLAEYQSIIDGNEQVIYSWLEENVTDYKSEPVYQSFEEGVDADPEQNSPAKLFASLAWVQKNVPHIQDVVAEALESFKQEVAVR